MKIIRFNNHHYGDVLRVLRSGGLVVAPSDTVYGLLVDATNKKAVEKLIKFKSRPPGKAISVFLSDFTMMKKYVNFTSKQKSVLKELLPGPFTIVLQSKHNTSNLLESEKGTLGIRIPDNTFITKLVKEFGRPITATSANIAGKPPHYQISSLLKELSKSKKQLIDLIIDRGKLRYNKPSTVIDFTSPTIKMLREGDIVQATTRSFRSTSTEQTKKIGQYLLQRYMKDITKKPLIFIIEGELGVGKTVMVKGIAEMLNVHNIISPTFVVYYEYKTSSKEIKLLYHFDLYNVLDSEEFKHLGIEDLLRSHTLLCFEWGEKTGEIIEMLKSKAKIIYITMKYVNEKERKITINN